MLKGKGDRPLQVVCMNESSAIYLDHNASSPPSPAVVSALQQAIGAGFGNPSSPHLLGRRARVALADAREAVAGLAGCDPDRLVFTSGATESCNRVIERGARPGQAPPPVIVSSIEHAAVLAPYEIASRSGRSAFQVGVDAHGLIDLASLSDLTSDGRGLVSIQWVNNEIGVIQRVEQIARICREHGVLLHIDASQALGKVGGSAGLDLDALDADFVSMSGHKIGAPAGVGALYIRDRRTIASLQCGGEQEHGRRAGTENLLGIIGFGAAARERRQILPELVARWAELQASFEAALPNGCRVNGRGAPRVSNTVSAVFPGIEAAALLARLDARGIYASQGSACHSARPEPSHVLRAIGLSEHDAYSTIRFSFGAATSKSDLDLTIAVLNTELQQSALRSTAAVA
jgi:cysteine desulfurase